MALGSDWEQCFQEAVKAQSEQRWPEAKKLYENLLKRHPTHGSSLNNLGCLWMQEGQTEQAKDCFLKAIESTPDYADPMNNLANVYKFLNQHELAIHYYQMALTHNPRFADAHNNLGILFQLLGKPSEALQHLKAAIQINPDHLDALNNLGNLYLQQDNIPLAIQHLQKALSLQPNLTSAAYNLGLCHSLENQQEKAMMLFEKALPHAPTPLKQMILCELSFCQLKLCLWDHLETQLQTLIQSTQVAWQQGFSFSLDPFEVSALNAPLDFQNKVSQHRSHQHDLQQKSIRFDPRSSRSHPILKVGFISPDFNRHPVSILLRDQWKYFDRNKIEVHGYLNSRIEDRYTTVIASACDQFKSLADHTSIEAATQINRDQIDILIDLSGHTRFNALPILAHRPAPIQCHAIGYMGSLQSPFVDYLIADKTLIPDTVRKAYSESMFYLPECSIATDSFPLPQKMPSRKDFNLPESVFIYCGFGASYRIQPAIFKSWMKILQSTRDSILWLNGTEESIRRRLQDAAETHGVQKNRLYFCENPYTTDHWGIYLADLCLDTHPISGGTGTLIALWAGIPVLTLANDIPLSRTSSSLLTAYRLQSCICDTHEAYVQLAVDLHHDASRLKMIKNQMERSKKESVVFQPQRYIHQLQAGLHTLWEQFNRYGKADIDLSEVEHVHE